MPPRPRSGDRSYIFVCDSSHTIEFEWRECSFEKIGFSIRSRINDKDRQLLGNVDRSGLAIVQRERVDNIDLDLNQVRAPFVEMSLEAHFCSSASRQVRLRSSNGVTVDAEEHRGFVNRRAEVANGRRDLDLLTDGERDRWKLKILDRNVSLVRLTHSVKREGSVTTVQ